MTERAGKQQLLTQIENRRKCVLAYLQRAKPRAERLMLTSVVSSALAAALTAGPALGGTNFTAFVADSFSMANAAAVWRPLCLLAMIVSVVAAITANLGKAKHTEARIASAETSNIQLEFVHTLLLLDEVSVSEALKRYQEAASATPFIHCESAPVGPSPTG